MRPFTIAAWAAVCLVVAGGTVAGCGGSADHRQHDDRGPRPTVVTSGRGPAAKYDCALNGSTDAFTGAYATASAIGWEANQQGVVTCLGGVFLVQDGIYRDYGFGIYNGAPTTWTDADGYLPAQITTFQRSGATVTITEFADRLVLGGHAFVAVYSRVAVHNPTGRPVTDAPDPTSGMVVLPTRRTRWGPSVGHPRLRRGRRPVGNDYPWPTAQALADAGTFDQHFEHMRNFWNQQLAGIADVEVPTLRSSTPTGAALSSPR